MATEEILRFEKDVRSNPKLLAQVRGLMTRPKDVITLVGLASAVAEWANEVGYNFSESEIEALLIQATLLRAMRQGRTRSG